ncbi:MAG: peptidase C39 family protein, partial [Verrucomicrobiae bacterium]|nr:peptidase C39 family protein [Verrucomicrobiae bacterium]
DVYKRQIMGLWTESPGHFPRQSVNEQIDEDGEVRTDILVLAKPSDRMQLRVTFNRAADTEWPRLRFLGAVVSDPAVRFPPLRPKKASWGRVLEVPCKSQVDYPEAVNAWCSPTCVSMVLSYWAKILVRPELHQNVPTIARAVFDPSWQGTGNWSFNTAYAARFAKMRAYVSRFSDVAEIEAWILKGVPVVASVCYDRLRGLPRRGDGSSGHLVVCVGFNDKGDVVVNDPGTRTEVRRVVARSSFVEAWNYSNRTVYLIYPEQVRPPADRFGHWFSGH